MIFCVSFLFPVLFGCTSVDCSVALKTYHGKYVIEGRMVTLMHMVIPLEQMRFGQLPS